MDNVLSMDVQALEGLGFVQEKDSGLFSVHLRFVGGCLPTHQMRTLAGIANRYAQGYVYLTSRQGVKIPHIPKENIPKIAQMLKEVGLEPVCPGNHVRGVTACLGHSCRNGKIDSQLLAKELSEQINPKHLRARKFKIAVTGCSNSCVRPRGNDLGIMGTSNGNYAIFVGGHMGISPRMGHRLPTTLTDKHDVIRLTHAAIAWFCQHAKPGERFGRTIERIGIGSLLDALNKDTFQKKQSV